MKRKRPIAIRTVTTLEGMRQCQDIQNKVWGFADMDVVPHRFMAVVSRNGGMLIGAFDGRRMVGFAFSYPGFRQRRPVHCSHMLAVLASHTDRGIGFRLKQAQRRRVLAQGLDLMLWTFDPLEGKNAYLNLHRLGAVSSEFWVNLYGRTSSVLHHGLDTDRLVAQWSLRSDTARACARGRRSSPSAEEILGGSGFRLLNDVRFRGGVPMSSEPNLRSRKQRVALEIPFDSQVLRLEHPRVARAWQLKVRRVLRSCFRRGYRVFDFASGTVKGHKRSFYLLEKCHAD